MENENLTPLELQLWKALESVLLDVALGGNISEDTQTEIGEAWDAAVAKKKGN